MPPSDRRSRPAESRLAKARESGAPGVSSHGRAGGLVRQATLGGTAEIARIALTLSGNSPILTRVVAVCW